MKKILYILSLLFITSISLPLFAQENTDDDDTGNDKIRDKMSEYIQKRLDLSKDETEKFAPVFIRYFQEWRQTMRENRGDRLILQQKIVDLRLRYRPQFKDIIGDKRGNQVFRHQDVFVQEIIRLNKERRLRNAPKRPIQRQRVNKVL